MVTKIIAAFPGTGKSYYHKNNPENTLDSDSSEFSWIIDNDGNKVRNPDFPNNYIKHIKENIGKKEFIFVSSHDVVREALVENCIFFHLVFPASYLKEEYIQRYKDRGSPEAFIKLVEKNWDEWLNECENQYGCELSKLHSNQTVTDVCNYWVKKEAGLIVQLDG